MCVVIGFCVLGAIIDCTLSLIIVCLMIEITLSLGFRVEFCLCGFGSGSTSGLRMGQTGAELRQCRRLSRGVGMGPLLSCAADSSPLLFGDGVQAKHLGISALALPTCSALESKDC